MNGIDGIAALAFDTGGTILDWHGGLVAAFAAAGRRHGIEADWHEAVNAYRRRSLKAMIGQRQPAFNIDDVHRRELDGVLADYGLAALDATDRETIQATWHRLDAWPGFPEALARIRTRHLGVSFTILSTALVMAVSRHNRIAWDAVVSCEMIGVYKTEQEAYRTCARWLALPPERILMVACHNFDLRAARQAGYRTAFVRRPAEWGPAGPPDPEPDAGCDVVVDDFAELAAAVVT